MKSEFPLDVFNKAIDRVLQEPIGPKRWRAANDMWLTLSPKNKALYKAVVKENREFREALGTFNKFATSEDKNSNLRQYLNVPTGAYYTIERADPDVFKKKENAVRFFKEFREYTTAEVY